MPYVRNHLIESPKSIYLHFQLAYSCPFWLIALNDSLVSGIFKSVFCGSDYASRHSYSKPQSQKKAFPLWYICSKTVCQEICVKSNVRIYGKSDRYVAHASPLTFICSFIKQYSLTVLFMPSNEHLS